MQSGSIFNFGTNICLLGIKETYSRFQVALDSSAPSESFELSELSSIVRPLDFFGINNKACHL